MRRVGIGGISKGYENACQVLLQDFLDRTENTPFEEIFPNKKISKEWSTIFESIRPDIDSGQMRGAVMSHFAYIKKQGYDAWIAEGERREQNIDWEPTTETPYEMESS